MRARATWARRATVGSTPDSDAPHESPSHFDFAQVSSERAEAREEPCRGLDARTQVALWREQGLTREQQEDLDAFENAVRKLPEVMECYLMSGEYDYLLRVVVANTADYERIHREHITRLPGVARVRSGFALRTVTKHTDLPIRQT